MPLYDPTVFNVGSQAEAKAIILTPEAGMSPEERWERETPDIIRRLKEAAPEARRWLDYGCGIGRLAKPLIDEGHTVVGVDFSADMRRLAKKYAQGIEVLDPIGFDWYLAKAEPFDAAYAVWALQHIPKIDEACGLIYSALKPGGILCLVNRIERVLPTTQGWMPDGKDVPSALEKAGFTKKTFVPLPGPLYADGSIWSEWVK